MTGVGAMAKGAESAFVRRLARGRLVMVICAVALALAAVACEDTARVSPTPPPTATVIDTPTPPPTPTVRVPTATPSPTPTRRVPTPTPTAIGASTESPRRNVSIATVELPDWALESPTLANYIANSDVIVRVEFLSVDSEVFTTGSSGSEPTYDSRLTYRFRVLEYLKGDGEDEIAVSVRAERVYLLFPDVIGSRTREEAESYTESWLAGARSSVEGREDAVLLLHGRDKLAFSRTLEPIGPYGQEDPLFGEAWLAEVEEGVYRHWMKDGSARATISLADLKARIAELDYGEYSECVGYALWHTERVRRQNQSGYQELDPLAGYFPPDPLVKVIVTLKYQPEAGHPVFQFWRPPYGTPRFSHYWLDGQDKDLFVLDVFADDQVTYEKVSTVQSLPPGEYSIHFNQYHRSLPCDQYFPDWRITDTAEWVLRVEGG